MSTALRSMSDIPVPGGAMPPGAAEWWRSPPLYGCRILRGDASAGLTAGVFPLTVRVLAAGSRELLTELTLHDSAWYDWGGEVVLEVRRPIGSTSYYAYHVVYAVASSARVEPGPEGLVRVEGALNDGTQYPGTEARSVLVGGVVQGSGQGGINPLSLVPGPAGAWGKALHTARRGMVLYDSGVVAAGALIETPVLDLTVVEALLVVVLNGGAVARNVGFTSYLEDGATVIWSTSALRAVLAGATESIVIGSYGAASQVTLVQTSPVRVREKWTLAAGGAGNGRLTLFGR